MPYLDRFSISLDTELLAAFDRHIAARGYENRSEAIRDLIRRQLTTARLRQGDQPAAAFFTFVCDHAAGEAAARLRQRLVEHADLVSASVHMSLDENRDFAAIALKGTADQIRVLADHIQSLRGIRHANLAFVPLLEPQS